MSEAAQGSGSRTGAAHIDSICDFVRRGLETVSAAIIPPESARQHFRESRIEFLRGIRSLIDHRIDRISQKNQTGTRVTVE
jgi:hypothetical protein